MNTKLALISLGVILLGSCGQPIAKSDNQKVNDNQVVVVKENGTIGVFRLFNQTHEPETTNYVWELYEIDLPDKTLNELDSGQSFAGHEPWGILSIYNDIPIRFGPFKYRWSINQNGRGWVYFKAPRDGGEQSYCIANGYPKYSMKELIAGCNFKAIKKQ